MKILVIKRDKIGDMLLMTPMLTHLRRQRPDAEIHVLANDYNAWVVRDNPDIDRLWIYPRVRHGGRLRPLAAFRQVGQTLALWRQKFDVAIAAGGGVSPRAIARATRLGAGKTIGVVHAHERAGSGLTDPQVLPPGTHEVEANLGLLAPLGIAPPSTPVWPTYRLPQRWQDFGREWAAERGIAAPGYVVMGLNARREARKPTIDQILRWSEALHARHGLHTVFNWQPGEAGNRLYPGDDARVAERLKTPPPWLHPFRSADDIMPVLGVISQARASMFPDGGIAHMASVSPGGVLSLFARADSSSDPDHWRPHGPRCDYLDAPTSIADLPDELVLGRLQRLIESYPAPLAVA